MATIASPAGLTQAEAERKLASRPVAQPTTSRSYKSIVVANTFTIFNLILLVAGVVTLAFGEWQDALFLGVLVANAGIGIAQEVRAKRTLDRLAALVAPTAAVIRDGSARHVAVAEVVEGDVVVLEPGDQVVADGTLRRSDGLALDESILTGEAAAVSRAEGEEVRSGSFAVEGGGAYVVTAVGEESYAARVAGAGARVPPSAVAARALDQPAPPDPGRGAAAARRRARVGALPPPHLGARRRADDRRSRRHARSGGPHPAHEPHVRRRGDADGAPRRARRSS